MRERPFEGMRFMKVAVAGPAGQGSRTRWRLWLWLLVFAGAWVWPAGAVYYNPVIASGSADPWVLYTNGFYYHTRTTGGDVRVYKTATLPGLGNASYVKVFTPNGQILSDIWAPELHYLQGKWYIYATGNIVSGTKTQRLFVLEGTSQDPQGSYSYKGLIDTNTWQIDGTVLVRDSDQAMFLVWSQSDAAGQSLYIAALANPWTLGSTPVRISTPSYAWEKHGNVNEGPEILKRNGKTMIIYSASGTWTTYYCLGMLVNTSGLYTNAASWTKFSNPLFQQAPANGTYCVGHCSFTKSPSGAQDWLVYHGSSDPTGDQMSKRYARIQRFWWNTDDTPNFDVPTPSRVNLLSPDEAPSAPTHGLRAEYYPNTTLSGTPTLTTNVTMDFNWGTGAPLWSIGTDGFSVRWTGKLFVPAPGTYTLETVSDDGVRLWLGGQLLVNNWTSHSQTTNTATATLAGGKCYDLKLEYFENTGSALVSLLWTRPNGTREVVPGACLYPFTNGLSGEYFNDMNLSNSVARRLDGNVDFEWSSGIPEVGVPADSFSVRWTGQVQPRYTDTYTFYVNSDNGRRLWVNNQLLIDAWLDNSGVEYSGTINLVAGQKYDVRLEYFDHLGGASCHLYWSSAQQAREVVPPSQLLPPANMPPVLQPVSDQSLLAGQTLSVSNGVYDPDLPAQTASFSLLSAPAGAVINANSGLLTWRPTLAQAPSTNLLSVQALDNGSPPLSTTQSFRVYVQAPPAPALGSASIGASGFSATVSGAAGPDYYIETSTNLAGGWQPLLTTNPPVLPFQFSDPAGTNLGQRFYRVKLGP